MESILGIGTAYVGILCPALIISVIFYFDNKSKKEKYDAMIKISKNLKDQSGIKELLGDFKEKKQPIDYRRSGVGSLIAGYLYPNESAEITKAVESFEKK